MNSHTGEGATIPSPLAGVGDSARLRRAGRGVTTPDQRNHAKAMRSAPTEAETQLWKLLRAKRLDVFKFRRQQPIGPFIADFVCMKERVIIEADGSQHIENESDPRRTVFLEARGYRMLRFWNADVLARPDDVAQAIYRALMDPSPRSAAPSRPLPQGEREESDASDN